MNGKRVTQGEYNGAEWEELYPKTVGENVFLDDYEKPGQGGAIAKEDSVNMAVGKLEKNTEIAQTTANSAQGTADGAQQTAQAAQIAAEAARQTADSAMQTATNAMQKEVYDTNNNGIVDNAEKVNGLTVETAVPQNAKFTDTVYTHPNSGVPASTYKSVTVDAQGHVKAGSNPTTLAGYGITDAVAKSDISTSVAGTSVTKVASESAVKSAYDKAALALPKDELVTLSRWGYQNNANNIPDGARACNVNTPSGAGACFVMQMSYNNPVLNSTQIATKLNADGPIYVRRRTNGVWSAWTQMLTTAGGTVTGELNVEGALCLFTGIELFGSNVPYLDFKYGITDQDYSSRLYCTGTGNLLTSGNFRAQGNIYATNFPGSAERYKENIRPLTLEEAQKILKAQAVAFDWKEDSPWNGKGISMIAEDVEKLDPRFTYEGEYVKREAKTHVNNETGKVVVDEPEIMGKRIEGLTANAIIAAQNTILKDHEKQIAALKFLLVSKGVCTQQEVDAISK